MNSCTDNERIELQVENFGPIAEAKVDMRSLNVFVGPSNSGKSYLATLIYAIHRFLREYESIDNFNDLLNDTSPESIIEELAENQVIVDYFQTFADSPISNIVPAQVINEICTASIKTAYRSFTFQLERYFTVDHLGELIRRRAKAATIRFVKQQSDRSKMPTMELKLERASGDALFKIEQPDENSVVITDEQTEWIRKNFTSFGSGESFLDVENEFQFQFIFKILKQTFHAIAAPFITEAFHLPADRAGVMRLQTALLVSLAAKLTDYGISELEANALITGLYADFLGVLIGIEDESKQTSEANLEIAKSIESNILKGSVCTKNLKPKLTEILFHPDGWGSDLALTSASSMTLELVPLVLYLRHLILPGNVLIVEEPESHIYPQMQVELIRQLAMVANSGVRVIVTTHSNLIVEELANIVLRSKVQPKGPIPTNSNLNYALNPNQVGVWRFEEGKNTLGSKLTEIVLNESDLYPSGFDSAETEIHNQWAVITDSIENNS